MAEEEGRRPAGKDSVLRRPHDLCTRRQQLCTGAPRRIFAAFAGSVPRGLTVAHRPHWACAMVGPRRAGWMVPTPRPPSNRRRTLPEESTHPAVNPDAAHIWSAIQNELKRAVPEHTYDLWLA